MYIESRKIFESRKIPWEFLTEIMNNIKGGKGFSYFDMEKHTGFEDIENIHDKIFVRLHNDNFIRKRIKLQWKIMMCLRMIRDCYKSLDIDICEGFDNFRDWYYHAEIKIYRGVPRNEVDLSFEKNIMRSFTIDLNTAIKFTDMRWAHGIFTGGDKSGRNGIVIEALINPSDVHIYSDVGYEYEVIPKDLNNIRSMKVKNSELV